MTVYDTGVVRMVDAEKIMGDAIGSIVEKILMEMGLVTHDKIAEILVAHNLNFSGCYQNPDVLNYALKELYGQSYMVVVEKIKAELAGLEEEMGVNRFTEAISTP